MGGDDVVPLRQLRHREQLVGVARRDPQRCAFGERFQEFEVERSDRRAAAHAIGVDRAKDAFTADAWSKVMFIYGWKEGLKLIEKYKLSDFEVVWVDDKNEVHMTPTIEKQLQMVALNLKNLK